MGLGDRNANEACLGVGQRSWAHLWGSPGVCWDLGAPVVVPKCQFTNSLSSRVLLSQFRVLDFSFGWERFLSSKCDWFILFLLGLD